MKSIVIYYSQTGNTKKIAQAIHAGMSKSGEQCDIARLKDVSPQDLGDYDLIGLGSPVLVWREPANLTGFIEGMKSVEGKHGFAFNTHGLLPSYHLASVVPAMIQRGLIIIGWNDWFGSVVYPPIPTPYFSDGHPDAIDLKEAEDFGREMVERSRRIYQGETQLIPTFPKGKEYDEIYFPVQPSELIEEKSTPGLIPEWTAFLKGQTIEFKINPKKCKYPKCTYCIDNCPTGCIDFSFSPPSFNTNFGNVRCIKCCLCEQTCPYGAIEVNYEAWEKAHDYWLINVLMPTADHYEKLGRFRRLVPLKDIGWDTRFWRKKHPRFKIDY